MGKALSLKPSCLTAVAAAQLIWPNAPPICRQTIELVGDATRGWHRTTHWLHHLAVRDAAFAVLAVAERLQREDALLASFPLLQQQQEHQPAISLEDADPPLPLLPPEIWFHIIDEVLLAVVVGSERGVGFSSACASSEAAAASRHAVVPAFYTLARLNKCTAHPRLRTYSNTMFLDCTR